MKNGAPVTLDQRVVTCLGTKQTISLDTAKASSTSEQWTEVLACDSSVEQAIFKIEQFNIGVDSLEMINPKGDEIMRKPLVEMIHIFQCINRY